MKSLAGSPRARARKGIAATMTATLARRMTVPETHRAVTVASVWAQLQPQPATALGPTLRGRHALTMLPNARPTTVGAPRFATKCMAGLQSVNVLPAMSTLAADHQAPMQEKFANWLAQTSGHCFQTTPAEKCTLLPMHGASISHSRLGVMVVPALWSVAVRPGTQHGHTASRSRTLPRIWHR